LDTSSPQGELENANNLDEAKFILENEHTYAQPGHVQTFTLQGTTAGTPGGVKLYVEARYRMCSATEQTVTEQYICPARSQLAEFQYPTLNQQSVASFFNLGTPVAQPALGSPKSSSTSTTGGAKRRMAQSDPVTASGFSFNGDPGAYCEIKEYYIQ
jgi:hypothetical protein